MRHALYSCLMLLTLTAAASTPAASDHWAFQPVKSAPLPKVQTRNWANNPIDFFILQSLESKGIQPNSQADKITLLRRAYLDLIGIPPTPAQVQAFLENKSPRAYETVVEELLASPQYGERWARHWLDLARYAESEGFKADETRPHAWRYRDYVIQALNKDKPYDQF